MTIKTMKITPAIAKKMLEFNKCNREVSESYVRYLANEMLAGRWKLNGDAIRFNEDGSRLIDGQNRLMAVEKSGVTIESLVIYGLPSDVFDTIDVGKKRSAADTLSVHGEKNCKTLAAALVIVDRYSTGRMTTCVRYSNSQIEELLTQHPQIRRSVDFCKDSNRLLHRSALAACHYLFARMDEKQADKFVTDLVSGLGLIADDPVYVLRRRLESNLGANAKLSIPYLVAITIKAWNFRRSGRSLGVLRLCENESFPQVI